MSWPQVIEQHHACSVFHIWCFKQNILQNCFKRIWLFKHTLCRKNTALKNDPSISRQHHSDHTPFFNIAKNNMNAHQQQSLWTKPEFRPQFTLRKEYHSSSSWVGRQTLSKYISKQRTIEMIPENIVLTLQCNSNGIPFWSAPTLRWFA